MSAQLFYTSFTSNVGLPSAESCFIFFDTVNWTWTFADPACHRSTTVMVSFNIIRALVIFIIVLDCVTLIGLKVQHKVSCELRLLYIAIKEMTVLHHRQQQEKGFCSKQRFLTDVAEVLRDAVFLSQFIVSI
ncbi:hypothetical protein KIN20_020571 [Parelaphostrongylus tenuis]|uniref:7TM GPCR serpentine receptor class x (Srx) domain-containing protein n=1 Tax=Parelaphostrongylus tenuis TaxID=148309 RepID=A0AAD5N632_PARTN|nr:hypothetical protein KIN20_020571 [Parelaphostrongylus tenuis]